MDYKVVGSAVILSNTQGSKIILGYSRKLNAWTLAGGKVEPGETIKEGGIRETYEETGIALHSGIVHYLGYVDGYDFTAHIFSADAEGHYPKVMEPDIHSQWDWFPITDLPRPMWSETNKAIRLWLTQ